MFSVLAPPIGFPPPFSILYSDFIFIFHFLETYLFHAPLWKKIVIFLLLELVSQFAMTRIEIKLTCTIKYFFLSCLLYGSCEEDSESANAENFTLCGCRRMRSAHALVLVQRWRPALGRVGYIWKEQRGSLNCDKNRIYELGEYSADPPLPLKHRQSKRRYNKLVCWNEFNSRSSDRADSCCWLNDPNITKFVSIPC